MDYKPLSQPRKQEPPRNFIVTCADASSIVSSVSESTDALCDELERIANKALGRFMELSGFIDESTPLTFPALAIYLAHPASIGGAAKLKTGDYAVANALIHGGLPKSTDEKVALVSEIAWSVFSEMKDDEKECIPFIAVLAAEGWGALHDSLSEADMQKISSGEARIEDFKDARIETLNTVALTIGGDFVFTVDVIERDGKKWSLDRVNTIRGNLFADRANGISHGDIIDSILPAVFGESLKWV